MKKRLKGLSEAFTNGRLVRVNRKRIDEHELNGYVVGLSDDLLLMHEVDGSTLLLNGYETVRLKDVQSFREDASFVASYLPRRNIRPVVPKEIDLTGWPSLIASVARQNSLFMIETEEAEPGVGFIGRIEKLTTRILRLKKVDPKGIWITSEDFKMKDITKVSFADGYIQALEWLVAYDERAKRIE